MLLGAAPYSQPIGGQSGESLTGIWGFAEGPPKFIRPYLPSATPATPAADLPLMLYIPGIDGTGLAASRQFPALVKDFDLRSLSIPGSDRTPFSELVRIVRLESALQTPPPLPPLASCTLTPSYQGKSGLCCIVCNNFWASAEKPGY